MEGGERNVGTQGNCKGQIFFFSEICKVMRSKLLRLCSVRHSQQIYFFHKGGSQAGVTHTVSLGHPTLGIECKGVLSTGVDRMLARNRIGVVLTRSAISFFAPIYISHHRCEKNCPHGSEPPVVRTGHPELYPGFPILPTRPATSYKPNKSAISGIRITTRLSRPYNLITIACGWWSNNAFKGKKLSAILG